MKMPEKIEKALKSCPKLWEALQRITPSLQRNYILWPSDAKKPDTFERRLDLFVDEVMSGKPTSMH
jgi:uncharacterized protein YdeI (YjbR/CyaY-like superfamily)